eukprot:scaffold5184_cov39-Cyclotella_meneghiniana.AAC.7
MTAEASARNQWVTLDNEVSKLRRQIIIAERSREAAKGALDLLVNSNNGIDSAVTNTAVTAPIADTPAASVTAPIAANPSAIIATTNADTPIATITIPIAPTPAATLTNKIAATPAATFTAPSCSHSLTVVNSNTMGAAKFTTTPVATTATSIIAEAPVPITIPIIAEAPVPITIQTGALKENEASTAAVATQAAMTSPITQATKTAASIASSPNTFLATNVLESPVVAPVHEFTLRVGDVIRCQHVTMDDDYAEVTVREIRLGNTIGDGLYVWTTSIMHTVGYFHRQSITLIHSIHDDAPPLGEMIEIDDINLEPGSLPKAALQELKENLRKSIDNLPGGTETMALAMAVDKARKTLLSPTGGAADTTSEHHTDWVVFHPIKLSDNDAIIVEQFQSDLLAVFCKSTDIVTLQELKQAKLGEEFAVVDRIDPVQDQEWRRVGEKGLLSGWDDTYRPPLEQHYDEAFVQARKRQVDCLEDEEELDVTPRRKKRRDNNVSAVSCQARTMKRDATYVDGAVQFKVGDVVDPKVITYVIVEKKDKVFRLANSAGVLKDCIHPAYLTSKPNATQKLMNLEAAFEGWRGLPKLPTRGIASKLSLCGGQGKSGNKCGCKSGKCNTNKCKCKQADRRCNSSCHGGQTNINCINCIDEPFDLSMCREIDGVE